MIETLQQNEEMALGLGGGLDLVLPPGAGEGKTAQMAKGLCLRHRGKVLVGGGGGFGLPVLQHGRRTIFPSLESFERISEREIEAVYRFDRDLVWEVMGCRCPRLVTRTGELIVGTYMAFPRCQRAMLMMRHYIGRALRLRGIMESGGIRGSCRVCFRAEGTVLGVEVQADIDGSKGRTLILNEASGIHFWRLRAGSRVLENDRIPGWQRLPLTARLEAPDEGLSFSLLLEEKDRNEVRAMEGGREVAYDLNWSGFSLAAPRRTFSYSAVFSMLNC